LYASENEHGLVARSVSAFEAACCERRAYVARQPRKDGLLLACALFEQPEGDPPEVEAAGLCVLREVRRLGLMRWLLASAMVHRLATTDYDGTVRFISKIHKNNQGPISVLKKTGFGDPEPIELDPAEFGGAIDHMKEADDDKVHAFVYRFDASAFDALILGIELSLRLSASCSTTNSCLSRHFVSP
jgi:hypothetical protein